MYTKRNLDLETNLDLERNCDFIRSFYNCIATPMYLYRNRKVILTLPDSALVSNIFLEIIEKLFKLEGQANYLIDYHNLFWGIIHLPKSNDSLIIGPIPTVPITYKASNKIINELLFLNNLESRNDLRISLSRLPSYSIEKSFAFINHLYLAFYNKQLQLDLLFKVSNKIKELPIKEMHSSIIYTNREIAQSHESYDFEQKYLNLLRNGNIEGLKIMFKEVPDISAGKIGETSLRQTKNIFIAATTTATRAAIEGGLPSVEAYNLSDVYIYNMEKMANTDQIYQFQHEMLMDFTKRVAQRKLPEDTSSTVFKCAQYIASHVNEPLTVQSVADYMGYSRPYLSKKFINELGFSISSFIARCKLEEGKNLLLYSDKTIGEISNYLCFSSQSYFQNVFKNAYGLTPNEYRKEI